MALITAAASTAKTTPILAEAKAKATQLKVAYTPANSNAQTSKTNINSIFSNANNDISAAKDKGQGIVDTAKNNIDNKTNTITTEADKHKQQIDDINTQIQQANEAYQKEVEALKQQQESIQEQIKTLGGEAPKLEQNDDSQTIETEIPITDDNQPPTQTSQTNGTMAIVLPHGVLFRGAAEGKIREKLLRAGNIYAVIGLPANLFYNTSIPTCIIVLKKHRDGRDVLFIDASKKFEKGKKQNTMTDEHINAVLELYHKRETVEKEAFLASFEDIEKNDFNLNIPRYVDNFEKEEEIDLTDLLADIKATDEELEKTEKEFLSMLKELTSSDEAIMASLNELIGKMEG